jgi:hypothetical protein
MSSQYHVQKANIQSSDKKQKVEPTTDKKQKAESTTNKKDCPLCPDKTKGTHTLLECRFLPAAVLALKKEQSASKKKEQNSTSNSKSTTNSNKKHVQKANVQAAIDEESESSDEDLLSALTWIKGSQKANREVDYELTDYTGKIDDYTFIFDNACSTRVQETRYIPGLMGHREKNGESFCIETMNGLRKIPNATTVEVKGFGKMICNNKDTGCGVISMHWCEQHYLIEVIRPENFTLSYHVHLTNYNGVVIPFDLQPNGTYLSSLKVLKDLDWEPVPESWRAPIMKKSDNEPDRQCKQLIHNDTFDAEEFKNDDAKYFTSIINNEIKPTTVDKNVVKVSETNVLRYAQDVVLPNIGFPAGRAFETMVNKGMLINVPIAANSIRKAEEALGQPTVVIKAKSNAQHRKGFLRKYIDSLVGKERLVLMDFVFDEEVVFLVAVSHPGNFAVWSYVGIGEGCRKAEYALPHIIYAFSTIKSMQNIIKFVTADGEKGFAKLVTEIQREGGYYIPINKREHLSILDNVVKKVKMIARASILASTYDPPRKLLVGAFLSANHLNNYLIYF